MYPSFSAKAAGMAGLTAESTIDLAARGGFTGVDLLIRDLVQAGADPAAIRDRMDQQGLIGGAWHLPVRWRGDEETFRRDLAELPALARVAALLGLTRTGTAVLAETPDRPRPGQDSTAFLAEVQAMHVRRLGAIAQILGDHGTRLGLEVVGVQSFRTGNGLPVYQRLADLTPLLETLWDQFRNVGILLDAFHLYAADESIEVGLAHGVDRIVWVHVADLPADAGPDRDRIQDGDRGLPGENGVVPLKAVLARLQQSGYDGPVTVESMTGCRSLEGCSAVEAAQKLGAALQSVWPDET